MKQASFNDAEDSSQFACAQCGKRTTQCVHKYEQISCTVCKSSIVRKIHAPGTVVKMRAL